MMVRRSSGLPLGGPGPDVGSPGLQRGADGDEVLPLEDRVVPVGLELSGDEHGGFEFRQVGPVLQDLGQLVAGGAEDPARAAVLEDLPDLEGVERGVDRDRGHAGKGAGEVHHDPFRPVLGQDGHPVACLQALFPEGQGQPLHSGLEAAMGDRAGLAVGFVDEGFRKIVRDSFVEKISDGLDQPFAPEA